MQVPVVDDKHRRVVRVPRRVRLQLHPSRYDDGPRAAPAAGDRRQRDQPAEDRRELGCARAPPRDRRLHLDRVGLPRRGGHRPHGVRRPPTRSASAFMAASTRGSPPVGDIDITGHRRPVSYWREIVWGCAPSRTSRCGRPSTTARRRHSEPVVVHRRDRRWSWPGFEGSRSRSRSTPTPTRSSCWSTADRRSGSPSVTTIGSAPSSRPPTQPGELVAVAYRDGARSAA